MQSKIVDIAIENLVKNTGIKAKYIIKDATNNESQIEFLFNNKRLVLNAQIRTEIRNHQLLGIADLNKNHSIIVAKYFSPIIKQELRKLNVSYLDIAGNIYIKTKSEFIWIEGFSYSKSIEEKSGRAFKPAGLKLIFSLLENNQLINYSQREISKKAGIALGNTNYIVNELKDLQFIIKKNKKELLLRNKKELLSKWISAYEETLKPTLHIGNFRFLNDEDYLNWKDIKLNAELSLWGSEPAGSIYTKFLKPEIFTIYTNETRENLIKNYRLIPDPQGDVKCYKAFWNLMTEKNSNVVPPLLAYADLLNTGDKRNVETANRIYEKFLRNKFE